MDFGKREKFVWNIKWIFKEFVGEKAIRLSLIAFSVGIITKVVPISNGASKGCDERKVLCETWKKQKKDCIF